MFSLDSNTKAKLLDVVVLSQKNRQPDDNPGAKLIMSLALSADLLAEFDGSLRSFLFRRDADAKQGTLDGMPDTALTKAGEKLGTLKWRQEMTGYTLVVDFGAGGKSNLELEDCKLDGWRLTPQEGGSVIAKVNVESSDVSEKMFGKLAKLKSREIEVQFLAPEPGSDGQRDLGDEPAKKPPPARSKKSATDTFVDQHAPTH